MNNGPRDADKIEQSSNNSVGKNLLQSGHKRQLSNN